MEALMLVRFKVRICVVLKAKSVLLQRMRRCGVDWLSVWRPSSTKPRSRPSPKRSSTPTLRTQCCLKPFPSSSTTTGCSLSAVSSVPYCVAWHSWVCTLNLDFCLLSLSEPTLLVRACNQLGQFLQHRETNLRYLALESMCTLASSEFSHEAVKTHIETVINALKVSPSSTVAFDELLQVKSHVLNSTTSPRSCWFLPPDQVSLECTTGDIIPFSTVINSNTIIQSCCVWKKNTKKHADPMSC